MFIIITRFCTKNSEEIFKGINLMSKYTSLRKGYVPSIMLINIMGYGLMAENENEMMAANLLEAMNKVLSEKIIFSRHKVNQASYSRSMRVWASQISFP